MLTLFSCPKRFQGIVALIQRNAIQSWINLDQNIEIILMGDDEGIREAASFFGVRHIPQVARNEYGTPLLDDVFSKAETAASYDIMGYINADIILLSDIIKAVEFVERKRKAFLMVGRRWNIDLEQQLDFSGSDWEEQLRLMCSDRETQLRRSGLITSYFPGVSIVVFFRLL